MALTRIQAERKAVGEHRCPRCDQRPGGECFILGRSFRTRFRQHPHEERVNLVPEWAARKKPAPAQEAPAGMTTGEILQKLWTYGTDVQAAGDAFTMTRSTAQALAAMLESMHSDLARYQAMGLEERHYRVTIEELDGPAGKPLEPPAQKECETSGATLSHALRVLSMDMIGFDEDERIILPPGFQVL